MMKATKTWVLIGLLLIPAINVHAWPIPDTGQTKCYNNTAEIPCPAPGEAFYGQDGNYSINLPSYTKLDATGNALPDDTAAWVMVRDNVTGLIWVNKTSDWSIHDGRKTFTWCDTNPATNAGFQGTCGTGMGTEATDTEAYIKALNDAKFGGFSDWRMPTPKELTTIADLSRYSPGINTAWFPNTLSSYSWSSSTHADSSYYGSAWCVSFGNGGNVDFGHKTNTFAVRAVRGGQSGALDHLMINGDGTVTDTSTGLMWQQETMSGKNWQAALAYAEGLSLAGYDDWRLPTKTELQTIVDYSRYNPAIDTSFFPGTLSSYYWSSSTPAPNDGYAWCVHFSTGSVGGIGSVHSSNKTNAHAVRAVRGVKSGLLGHLVISKSDSGTVTSAPTGIACGSQCTAYFYPGTSVTLTAQAASGFTFAGWAGVDCSGTQMTCQVTMDGDKTVTATFRKPGDVDGNGKIEIQDAIIALQVVSGFPTASLNDPYGDVNGNQKIDLSEAIYALQCIARLRNNHSPVLNLIGNKSIDESSNLTFTLSATDEDNDPLTFSVSPLPIGATFNASTKTFSWTPTYSQSGIYPVTFTVRDDYGGSASETVTITVNDKIPVIGATDYFPLNVGDWQEYISTGIVSRTTVSGTKSIGGYTAMIRSLTNGDKQYYSSDQNGIKSYGQYSASSGREIIFNPPLLEMPNNSLIGTINVSTSTYSFVYSGYTYNVNITFTTKILGIEDVQTANRTLKDCVKVSRQFDQYIIETGESVPGETAYYWLYKGVGSVKTDTQIISGSYVNGVQQTY